MPLVLPLKTPAAARALGTTYHRLNGLIRFNKLDQLPQRDGSGHYCWTESDMERARVALGIDLRRKEHRRAAGNGSGRPRAGGR